MSEKIILSHYTGYDFVIDENKKKVGLKGLGSFLDCLRAMYKRCGCGT